MTETYKDPVAAHDTDPRLTASRAMVRLVRRMRSVFDDQAHDMGLTYARAQTILEVSRREGLNQTALAECLDIETPTLNRTLDGLEKLGFLERRPDPDDKRVRQIYLTAHARANADQIERFLQDLRAQVYKGVSAQEMAQLQRTLDKMAANMAEMRLL
ncbi:MarR family transcriptional regulator [Thioclava sp. BHET1]|nr:MarR family transcriptional regulator [Thioclava sp. BHET1]